MHRFVFWSKYVLHVSYMYATCLQMFVHAHFGQLSAAHRWTLSEFIPTTECPEISLTGYVAGKFPQHVLTRSYTYQHVLARIETYRTIRQFLLHLAVSYVRVKWPECSRDAGNYFECSEFTCTVTWLHVATRSNTYADIGRFLPHLALRYIKGKFISTTWTPQKCFQNTCKIYM